MQLPHSLRLEPIVDLRSLIGDNEVVAFNVGPQGTPYVVLACNPLDYHFQNTSGVTSAKVVPDKPQRYRVLGLENAKPALDVLIAGANFNAHHVQPVEDGFLLVGSRSFRRGADDFDLNAHLFDAHGHYRKSFLLNDGVQDVQVTASGTIWTSYFDEGVFGNFGWREPVGAAGLIEWTSDGKRLYEFVPPAGLESIADCYALNVESDSVAWCYYYTDFALVRIHNRVAESYWKMPISGSHCFAISGSHALFGGDYDNRNRYSVFRIAPGERPVLLKQFVLELGGPSPRVRAAGRGDTIWLLAESRLYGLQVSTALNA
jgi:hypothetical protein